MTNQAGAPTDFESFLTWEALVDILSYDPAKGEFRWVKSGRSGWVGRVAGHVNRQHGYRTIVLSGRTFLVSRLAWLHETKEWPVGVIDHINGNRDDDRWDNLRDISPAENALNKALNRNNTSGVAGVYWDNGRKTYIVRLAIGRERKLLGSFDTIEEAKEARQQAEIEFYGEFRRLDAAPPAKALPLKRLNLSKTRAPQGVPADVASGLNQAILLRAISYDPATGEFRWLEARNGEVNVGPLAGKTNKRGYRVIGIGGRSFYGHRLAWLYVTGKWPDALIDHKDGNPSNNSWINLRQATRAQNNANRIAAPGKSGVTGVTLHPGTGKWEASASLNNKRVYLGLFASIEEAAVARTAFDEKERKDFGPRKVAAAPVGDDAEVVTSIRGVEYLKNGSA